MYAFKISFKEVKEKNLAAEGGEPGARSALLIHVALKRTRDRRGITFAWQQPGQEKEAVNSTAASERLQRPEARSAGAQRPPAPGGEHPHKTVSPPLVPPLRLTRLPVYKSQQDRSPSAECVLKPVQSH